MDKSKIIPRREALCSVCTKGGASISAVGLDPIKG